MFARFVSMRLKSGNLTEFNRILEKEVIPLLQRQKGFREEIVLTNPKGQKRLVSASGIRKRMLSRTIVRNSPKSSNC